MYQGRLECGLSPLGERQARALGLRLAPRLLAAVYTSPLRRAVRTAEIAVSEPPGDASLDAQRDRGIEIITKAELTDIDHGEWSGVSHAEVEERWPELSRLWRERPAEVQFPGGESLEDVRRRALTFLAGVRQEHAEGNLLIITHGEVLQLLLLHFLQMRPNQMWSMPRDNCALSIVEDYEPPLVMAMNDTCHLEGVRSSLSTHAR